MGCIKFITVFDLISALCALVICVLIFFIQAYIVGTHLNYLDNVIKVETIQMCIHTTCYYEEVCYYKEVDNIT